MNMRIVKEAAQQSGATIENRRKWCGRDVGFYVKFDNGYALSVCYGPGSYSTNRHCDAPGPWSPQTKYAPRSKVKIVELAMWGPDPSADSGYTDDFVVFEGGVAGHVSSKRLPEIFAAIAKEDFRTVCGLASVSMVEPEEVK